MKIEGNFNDIDEIDIGLHMYYGEDEYGSFHAIQIGLIVFSVAIYRYRNNSQF